METLVSVETVGIIVGIIASIAVTVGVVVAIVRRQDSQGVSGGGVVAPDNKGTINTKRDTITTDQATTVERAGDVHIEHHGLAGEDHDRLVRMETVLDEIARGTAASGTPLAETAALAAQATEGIEKKLEEALELFHADEYREAIERVLTAYDRELPPLAKAQLHLVAGNAFYRLSDYGAAEAHYKESLHAAPSAEAKANSTGSLGTVYAGRGDLEEAEVRYREALGTFEEIGDRSGQAHQLGNLGIVYARRGDLEDAEEHYGKALAIFEETGERSNQANQLGNLGILYGRHGDVDRAEEYLLKALDIDGEIGNRSGQANKMGNLGNVYAIRGDLEDAEVRYREALGTFEEIGDRSGQAQQFAGLGIVYARRGDSEGAEEHYRKALEIDEEIGNRLGQAQGLGNLGNVYADRGDLAGAEEHYQKALEMFEEIGAKELVSQTHELLKDLKATDD